MLDSDRYQGLSHDSERLLFIELLLLADDYGIVPLSHAFLRRRASPCQAKSPEQVTMMVTALADQDLVRVYHSERGGVFGFIPRFDNRPQALKPKWPLPPAGMDGGAIERMQAISKGLYRKQSLNENAPATQPLQSSYIQLRAETSPKPVKSAKLGTEQLTLTEQNQRLAPNVAPETETETDIPSFAKSRGARFTLAQLPEDWRGYCKNKRPDLDPETVFELFRNHWIAKPGKDGVKADWTATWRNWVLRESVGKRSHSSADVAAEAMRMIEERTA
jgi:hypothetical protein